jgi:peptidoglycan/xylan/chitin deacetylase (PgdA/CDA1 family)
MDPNDRMARRAALRARRRRGRRRLVGAAGLLAVLALSVTIGLARPWEGGDPPEPDRVATPANATTTGAAETSATATPATTAADDEMPTAAEQRAAVARVAALGLPIYRAGGTGRWIALTFDDGPGPYTETAMAALRDNGARATFFVSGKNMATWGHLARAETELAAVGDHTWSHSYLPGLSDAEMKREIRDSQSAVAKASGEPVVLMRPPFGARTPAIDAEVKRLGMLQVMWSVDSMDSQGAGWEEILRISKEGAKPGAIILMHENRGQTLMAVNRLLPWLRKRGIIPVTLPELLALDPPSLAQVRADARNYAGIEY